VATVNHELGEGARSRVEYVGCRGSFQAREIPENRAKSSTFLYVFTRFSLVSHDGICVCMIFKVTHWGAASRRRVRLLRGYDGLVRRRRRRRRSRPAHPSFQGPAKDSRKMASGSRSALPSPGGRPSQHQGNPTPEIRNPRP